MAEGFFSKKETQSISAIGGTIHSCASCGLYKDCQSPKMSPSGSGEKDIMIIGEAPGRLEDERGKPFQDRPGRLLKNALSKYGINLDRDCISLNAVNCRPPKDTAPTTREIDHCRSIVVWKALKKYQPKVIIPLGDAALQSLIGHRWSGSTSVTKWRGYTIPDQEIKSWICPTLNPDYLVRMDKPPEYMKVFLKDIKQAIEKQSEKFPRHSKPEIEIVEDLRFLEEVPHRLSSFDYETTGIKPQAKGHRIITTSIAASEDHAWAFKMPKTRKGRLPFRKWLANRDIPKMAHNLKYEDHWSREILKVPVRGWEWDTMLAAHILDNRRGTAGLKFQTYVNFGIMGYEEEVQQYFKSGDQHGDNTKNNIQRLLKTERSTNQLLKYNALDSVYQYRLAIKQMEQLNYNFLPF